VSKPVITITRNNFINLNLLPKCRLDLKPVLRGFTHSNFIFIFKFP
jgi:hypothetical protein